MGRDGAGQRRKGPAGTGRRRKQEKKYRVHSVKDAHQQLANLKKAQQEKARKAAAKSGNAAASGGPRKRHKEYEEKDGERGSGDEDSSTEETSKKKQKNNRSAQETPAAATSTGFEKAFTPEAQQEQPFKRFFWLGPKPEGEPDDTLKLMRKDLGVKVRGVPVPPPVLGASEPGLPPHFRRIFSGKQGGGLGLEKPTPIQAQVWPAALCGVDVIGIAPTGSGKTLAYLAPAVPHIVGQEQKESTVPEHTVGSGKGSGVSCLVLVPTRELAKQVSDACGGGGSGGWLKRLFSLRSGAVYGGTGKEVQLDSIATLGTPQVLAATPGRLLDLLGLDVLTLNKVTYLVLDEADRMLALGFEPQLQSLLKGIRPNRQVLLFSATFPLKLRTAAEQWMSAQRVTIRVASMELNGADVEAAGEDDADDKTGGRPKDDEEKADGETVEQTGPSTLTVSPTVHQSVEVCSDIVKPRKLVQLLRQIRAREAELKARQRSAVLVFCSQIKILRSTTKLVERQGERCAALHSGIPQVKREQALDDLKSGKVDTLVATDLASRGLHVGRLQHVVNFDFPKSLEVYCHRIGRVGRQGAEGWAHSFLTKEESSLASGLVSLLERCKQPVDARLRKLGLGKEPVLSEESAVEEGGSSSSSSEALEDEAPSHQRELHAGHAVRLRGLQSSPQLNGTRGRLCRWLPLSNRWEVVLGGAQSKVKALKAENLVSLGPSSQLDAMGTGSRVALCGLRSAPALNGLHGHVRRRVPGTDRWEVVLDNSMDVKAVRIHNIKNLKPEPSAEGAEAREPQEGPGVCPDKENSSNNTVKVSEIERERENCDDEAAEDEEMSDLEEEEEEEEEAEEPDSTKPSKSKLQRQRRQRRQQQRQAPVLQAQGGRKRKRKRESKKKRDRQKRVAATAALDAAEVR